MTVLIHVEVSARELDSKILLAVLAASHGHDVILGDVIGAAEVGLFRKAVFHTKSVTPAKKLLKRHGTINRMGCKITSQDEEAYLVEYGYESFGARRFSFQTIDQVGAIFCWGADDFEYLCRTYPSLSNRIVMTGSPRADLWRDRFSDFWSKVQSTPGQPFLLVASNMGVRRTSLSDRVRGLQNSGYFERDPSLKVNLLFREARYNEMLAHFVLAISFLAETRPGYQIVVRPHPNESVETWETLLGGIPGVSVIHAGSITAWVQRAFAVMHNGCTTALESTISGTPVVTYVPVQSEFLALPNDLGHKARDHLELRSLLDDLFEGRIGGNAPISSTSDNEVLGTKIFLDEEELAAEKIVRVWNELTETRKASFIALAGLWLFSHAKVLRDSFRFLNPLSRKRGSLVDSYEKFPALKRLEVVLKVRELEKTLGRRKHLKVNLVGRRTILIRGDTEALRAD